MEDRVLLVAAYCRTNLTMRQLAPLFGTSPAAVGRVINRHGPLVALLPAEGREPGQPCCRRPRPPGNARP
ncbi:helix-turn-helix domain-containing protein [Streptomyces sp. YGL11-2]|uniref:helix-turn-helix domain-containing protein n=1 Tax=Streptomyces sp. YGL11-2 TaxID=3414028 RepID=UPI003CF623C4